MLTGDLRMSVKESLFGIVNDLELIKFIEWLAKDSRYTFCVKSEGEEGFEEIYFSPLLLYFEFKGYDDDNLSLEDDIEKLFELATMLKDW